MSSWLELLTQSTVELEPPERFIYWAGIASLSAVVKKNIWLDRFSYKLYPNVYIILVSAKPGLRKSVPVDFAKSLVTLVGNTRVISGRNSVQSVIQKLSQQTTLENGTVIREAQAFLCAPELKSFMVGDDQALDILTDLHGTHEHEKNWANSLKSSPVEDLKSPCITLLGAANETMFDALINQKDLEGGFIGRTFIVFESDRRLINSLMYKPKFMISKDELAIHLKEVSKIKGEFIIEDSVRILYDRWYQKIAKVTSSDNTGTLDRIGDQCLKVAMLISLSDSLELKIEKHSMEEAIFRCEEFFAGTKRIALSGGKAETAPSTKLIIKTLLSTPNHIMERTKFLSKLFPDVDALAFDKAMDTLGEINGQHAVKMLRDKTSNKIYYQLNKEFVDQYKEFAKEEID